MPLKNTLFRLIVLPLVFLAITDGLSAQATENNDTFFLAKKKGLWGKLGKSLSISGEITQTAEEGIKRNEESFSRYKGKIIHSIIIQKLGFDATVNDTSKIAPNFFNHIANKLHTNTSELVIKRNLFFTVGDSLSPALLADNERFLRNITYLQDAKIIIKKNAIFNNEVDVIILCKDVFPIGGSAEFGSEKMVNFEINDDNLAGNGDRIEFKNILDLDRIPYYGFGGQFLKRNILGSFVNVSLGYSNIEPTFNSGRKEETVWYFKAELPLVSTYSKWTGSYETSIRNTSNNYLADSLYKSDYKYQYRIFDVWAGYNIGANKLRSHQTKNRVNHLVAIRGIYRKFFDLPNLFKSTYNSAYTNLTTVLASLSVFQQDYYHTNFIYGFGRNEDVPEGFSLSVIGGWTNKAYISRPYLGFDYQRTYFTKTKAYLNYYLRAGTYSYKNKLEDISLLTGIESFTRLRKIGSGKWFSRHFISGSITQQINTKLNDPIYLSSIYGIPDFNNAYVKASTRLSANCESVFYNTIKFFGFSFAPFAFTNLSYLKEMNLKFSEGDLYTTIGAGVRSRNENLVFGTMELRAFYYPRTMSSMNVWNIVFNTALQFKYNSQLVKRPDFITVN